MSQTLNSPLEVGVRIVALLEVLYPSSADTTRLVLLDHLILHSADFGGAESLHPQIPVRSGELGLKRELIVKALHLMGSRDLVERVLTPKGIGYVATDEALPFLESIESLYLDNLRNHCNWVAKEFATLPDEQIRQKLGTVFGQWAEEFHISDERRTSE